MSKLSFNIVKLMKHISNLYKLNRRPTIKDQLLTIIK